ncbi:hypothetical protein BDZ91DRAFT_731398 [Kalaharituber pfeilii]|nr:hypothetical protein BDZ91DRAFT_731398 [Kalaharituber pfeilii]
MLIPPSPLRKIQTPNESSSMYSMCYTIPRPYPHNPPHLLLQAPLPHHLLHHMFPIPLTFPPPLPDMEHHHLPYPQRHHIELRLQILKCQDREQSAACDLVHADDICERGDIGQEQGKLMGRAGDRPVKGVVLDIFRSRHLCNFLLLSLTTERNQVDGRCLWRSICAALLFDPPNQINTRKLFRNASRCKHIEPLLLQMCSLGTRGASICCLCRRPKSRLSSRIESSKSSTQNPMDLYGSRPAQRAIRLPAKIPLPPLFVDVCSTLRNLGWATVYVQFFDVEFLVCMRVYVRVTSLSLLLLMLLF